MTTKAFWLDLLERVVSTFAQATTAALPAGLIPGVSVPWWAAFATGGFAALLCALKCLAATYTGADDSASLLPAEVDPPSGDAGAGELRTILLLAAGTLLGLVLFYAFVLEHVR
jgi:hypothetical protein